MTTTTAERNLIKVASALGILQGSAWLLMSLACILAYNTGRLEVNPHESYLNWWNQQVYFRFLDKDFSDTGSDSYIVTPVTFTIFMWIYLVADLAWIIMSIGQLIALKSPKSTTLNFISAWIVITVNIVLLDLIFAILIGVDFDKCLKNFDGLNETKVAHEGLCTNIIIPVLVVICKGFVLMDINLIFAIILFKVYQSIKKRDIENETLLRAGTIPRATIQRTSPNLYPQQILQNNPGNSYGYAPTSGQNPWFGNYEGKTQNQNPAYLNQQQQFPNRY